MNQQANVSNDMQADRYAIELKHWTDLRRAVLSIVAAIQRAIPNGTYTLDIQIVPRDQVPPRV